jgi:hypothetical protein
VVTQPSRTAISGPVQGNAAFSVTAMAVAAGGLLVLWLWGSPLIRRVKGNPRQGGQLLRRKMGQQQGGHAAEQDGDQRPGDPAPALPRITLPAFGSLGDLLGELESPAWSAWRNPSVWADALGDHFAVRRRRRILRAQLFQRLLAEQGFEAR